MKKLALGAVGALAAGAAFLAAPQAAQAQFLSVGIGGPAYYGHGYGYGHGYPYYGGTAVSVGFGAPSYGYVAPYGVAGSYYDEYDDGYYAAPIVRQRVVYSTPRRVVRTRVVNRAYRYAAPHEIRGGYRTVRISTAPTRRIVVNRRVF